MAGIPRVVQINVPDGVTRETVRFVQRLGEPMARSYMGL
jgi:hypothetical protein